MVFSKLINPSFQFFLIRKYVNISYWKYFSIAELMEWGQYKMPEAHHHFKKRNRRDRDN